MAALSPESDRNDCSTGWPRSSRTATKASSNSWSEALRPTVVSVSASSSDPLGDGAVTLATLTTSRGSGVGSGVSVGDGAASPASGVGVPDDAGSVSRALHPASNTRQTTAIRDQRINGANHRSV
jgi:hypothetical protein